MSCPLSLALQLEGISTVTGIDIEACALASSLDSQDEACQGKFASVAEARDYAVKI